MHFHKNEDEELVSRKHLVNMLLLYDCVRRFNECHGILKLHLRDTLVCKYIRFFIGNSRKSARQPVLARFRPLYLSGLECLLVMNCFTAITSLLKRIQEICMLQKEKSDHAAADD